MNTNDGMWNNSKNNDQKMSLENLQYASIQLHTMFWA